MKKQGLVTVIRNGVTDELKNRLQLEIGKKKKKKINHAKSKNKSGPKKKKTLRQGRQW